MNKSWLIMALIAGALAITAQERPNIVVLMVDDMGYSDLGCYGSEIRTPHLDRLASDGIRYTQFYNTSKCWTTRISLLTGVYHNRGTYIDYAPEAVTFPEHFRANGYLAMAAGKVNHGLGEPDPRLWDQNGPDCGVLGTPFVGDELHTAKMIPERIIDRSNAISMPRPS